MADETKLNWQLQAALGWLELGNPGEAAAELDAIPEGSQKHPDVLELRWEIGFRAKRWNDCVGFARALTKSTPDHAIGWIHLAFALHELNRTQEAFEVLAPVVARFPKEPTIPYNLACYTCRLGRLVEARDWLAQAFALGDAKQLKRQAQEDPDLAALWAAESE